jgi:hypothetical protein
MTARNISKELLYSRYIDMENGNDIDEIDYQCLFGLLEELIDRIDSLEEEVNTLKWDKRDLEIEVERLSDKTFNL